jgi:membrane-bound serine protease (ClpP class)
MKTRAQQALSLLLRRPLRVVALAFAVAGAAVALAPVAGGTESAPVVRVIELANDINPVTADYVTNELDRAVEDDVSAVVIQLDTPGGLGSSMEQIYKKELAVRLPVVVWIGPDGATAASAGVWIAQAADVLAMAPQTNIGSSTPISGDGRNIPSDARRKAINHYAKSLRALAEEHGRNGDWAEAAVRRADNLTAREALDRDVIDLLAPSIPALLAEIDGRRAQSKGLTLDTAGARIERVEMSFWKRVLDTIVDPNVIAILFSIGLLGLVVELWNPGLIFPGTVGAISLIVGLFGAQVLPVSWAGVLLMLLAAAFWIAEVFVVSHGALALAGAVTFVLGALMLFDPAGPAYQVSIEVALTIAVTVSLFMLFAVAKLVQVRRKPVEVGIHSIVGAHGQVRRDGYVFACGELWQARPANGAPLRPGDEVEVTAVDGLTLEVRPVGPAAAQSPARGRR